jgi:catechol 2,3-dioxygenase-like lactoylglutathione lyase family enzyme
VPGAGIVSDLGLTHVALPVTDVDASAAFYARYADMQVVHRRVDGAGADAVGVVWLSDLTREFVVVLIQTEVTHVLGGWAHLGVACASREDVDARCADARGAGLVVDGPFDDGPPVGYWAILADPDGHHLELAHGQDVGSAVDRARRGSAAPGR